MTPRKKNRDVAIADQANIDVEYKGGGIDPQHHELGSTTPPERDPDNATALTNVAEMMVEYGASGTKMFGGRLYEEYNPKLQGLKGLELYDEMRRSDAQIHACLLALELPIRSTMWYIEPGTCTNEEGEQEVSDLDREIKDFVEKNLFSNMQVTWDDLLRQILTMCTFGFSVFEKVWGQDGDKIVLKNLAQRLARTVWTWDRDPDTGKYGVTQQLLMNDEGKPLVVKLPAEKVVIFSFRKEGTNMEGISVLRSAYKHWYIKDTLYKLDAVKHERQSVGIPIITLPDTHSEADGKEAENILGSLRSTEKTYIVLPSPDWKFEFAQLGGATVLDTSNSIEHHNREIVKNILAGFLDLGSKSSSGGSYALSEDQSSLFLLSLSAVAQQVCDQLNNEIIRDLVDLNFDLAENQTPPKLCFQKLGEVKYDELATSLATLTGAGLITPDVGTEEYVRKIFDLPKKEMDAEEDGDEEELDEEEETGETEADAQDEAIEEENDTEGDDTASQDEELTKLEDEMSKLEASEIEGVYEASLAYSDEDVDAFIFGMSPSEVTREKIRAGLVAYWDKKGRKAKPTLTNRKDNFDKRAKDASGKIKEAMDKYKGSVDPLKKQIDALRAQHKAGKLSKKQVGAKFREIKAQIKAIRDGKNEYVQTLKYIKRDALQGKKQVKATISARKKALAGVIKQITDEVKTKNSTRSALIKSLADQIKTNVQNYQAIKAQAKSKEEKAGLKSIYAQIKSENDTLRNTAKSIRTQSKTDREQAKAKKEELKKTAQMSRNELDAHNFTDQDELKAFLDARKFFDPQVLIRVQNYGS